jgi:NAD-dependent SIR2 family protein deacetylase
MGVFATGKYAVALCDRCGQQYNFNQLRQEWNGLKTCPECFDTKHPQLDPPYHSAEARPAREEPVTVFVGAPGDSAFESNGMQPAKQSRALIIGSSVGKVTVVIS